MSRVQTLGGIEVPATPVIEKAIAYAREACEPWLFNHSMRSWLFGARLARLQGATHDEEVVAVATLLHDITLNERFKGPRRFEVEGADLARAFVREAGFDDRRAQLVWDGVALNSTPSIALFKEPEVALATGGIGFDIIGLNYDRLNAAEIAGVLTAFPRLEVKKRIGACFCRMVKNAPETAHDNFLRDYGERFVPGYRAGSVVDLIENAPFAE